MKSGDDPRKEQLRAFEEDAEVLVAYQLDMLAHLERQVRATRHLMLQIEKLRTANKRVGPELSNGQRGDALAHLEAELDGIDEQLESQRQLCLDLHGALTEMQTKLQALRQLKQASGSHAEPK
jgi:prefoldin subunit 5